MGLVKDVPIRHRLRININLTAFTDEVHADVGAAAFILSELPEGTGHDWFSKEDLVIRTAASGGGTLLVEGTDYTLGTLSATRTTTATAAAGTAKSIYLTIQIINAAYQSGNLFFTGKHWGDYADPEDLNNITLKGQAKAADVTISARKGYEFIHLTTGASNRTVLIPAPVPDLDCEKLIMKADTGAGTVVVDFDTEGSSTCRGLTTITLYKAGEYIRIKSFGGVWNYIGGNAYVLIDSAALAANQVQPLPHGVGAVPSIAIATLLCISAEIGYSAGDEVDKGVDSARVNKQLSVARDATNLTTMVDAAGIYIQNKTSGLLNNADETKWKIRIRIPL